MAYYPVDWEKAVKRECRRRRYSDKTAKTYIACINRFLKYTKKELGKISKKDVRLFLEYLSENNKAGNTLNVYHMAIKFLFEDILKKRMYINIKYSKTPERLPVCLTKDELKLLFQNIKNPKHRLMIEFLYSSGLRVSELLNMKVNDLNLENGFGFVRKGKGKKDKLIVLSKIIIPKIRQLIQEENLTDFLFVSNRKSKYSPRSIQQILKNANNFSNKNIHPHALRHSFATHLIESGYAVNEVQALLGHKSPETSMIYLHTAKTNLLNIKSPLDK